MIRVNRLIDNSGPLVKKYFEFNQVAIIKNTGTHLDGQVVTVTGVVSRSVLDTYIVTFEKPQKTIDPEVGETFYQSAAIGEANLDFCSNKGESNYNESKLFIGNSTSGKTTASCRDAYSFLIKNKSVIFLYDSGGFGSDVSAFLGDRRVVNLSSKISEEKCLDMLEKFIDHFCKQEDHKKINRLIDEDLVPVLFYLDNFFLLSDKRRASSLLARIKDNNLSDKVVVYMVSDRSDDESLRELDISLVNTHLMLAHCNFDVYQKFISNKFIERINTANTGECVTSKNFYSVISYSYITAEERELLLNQVINIPPWYYQI